MKSSILLILSLFLAVTLSSQDISSALRQAQARFESGNEAGGIELVNKVLVKCPDNQEAKNLLAKFNQTIKDREIDADWKTAQTQNTFESYQQFRTKHPGSKYDDIASDNMAKKLADKFNINSTYADRTKAESYAKKAMTKDYIANKWKAAMAKKSQSTSKNSSYASNGYNPGHNQYSTYKTSSYSSGGYSSYKQKHQSYWSKEKKISFGLDFSTDTDCFYGDVSNISPGVLVRIGKFGSILNGVVGLKYSCWKVNTNFSSNYNSIPHSIVLKSLSMPVLCNVNFLPGHFIGVSCYMGAGYDFNIASDGEDNKHLSGSWIVQTGFGGKHWDFRIYGRIFIDPPVVTMEDDILGLGLTIYI